MNSVMVNVIGPIGAITYNQKGLAGLGAAGGMQFLADDYRNPRPTLNATIFSQKLGFDILATVNALPTPFTGSFGLTQLVSTVAVRMYKGNTTGSYYTEQSPLNPDLSSLGQMLDGGWIYYGWVRRDASGSPVLNLQGTVIVDPTISVGMSGRMVDNPSEGLSANYYFDITPILWTRQDDFSSTIMFQPSTTDSIPVPVGHVNWGSEANAIYDNSTGNCNLANGSGDQYYDAYVAASGNGDFPVWSHNATDAVAQVWRQTQKQ